MARSKLALKDFLARLCRIHPSPPSPGEEEYYVFSAADGRFFMTESHMREIFREVKQTGHGPAALKSGSDAGNAIMVSWRETPEIGIDQIRIPVKLVESLSEKQAFLILRNLEGIQRDVEEGRILKDRLENLFQDTATIKFATNEHGERVFEITGKLSDAHKRRYMERYAEQVASRTLFDVAKALNGRLSQYIPEESREKFFVEGRDLSDKKIRYGDEVGTELVLSDEGAWMYTHIVNKNPLLREVVAKLMQQAMLDPFGLSMTHYMGKHNVLKAGKRPLVKVPGLSGFFAWIKSLFVSEKAG
jgi:hypothetical protein